MTHPSSTTIINNYYGHLAPEFIERLDQIMVDVQKLTQSVDAMHTAVTNNIAEQQESGILLRRALTEIAKLNQTIKDNAGNAQAVSDAAARIDEMVQRANTATQELDAANTELAGAIGTDAPSDVETPSENDPEDSEGETGEGGDPGAGGSNVQPGTDVVTPDPTDTGGGEASEGGEGGEQPGGGGSEGGESGGETPGSGEEPAPIPPTGETGEDGAPAPEPPTTPTEPLAPNDVGETNVTGGDAAGAGNGPDAPRSGRGRRR